MGNAAKSDVAANQLLGNSFRTGRILDEQQVVGRGMRASIRSTEQVDAGQRTKQASVWDRPWSLRRKCSVDGAVRQQASHQRPRRWPRAAKQDLPPDVELGLWAAERPHGGEPCPSFRPPRAAGPRAWRCLAAQNALIAESYTFQRSPIAAGGGRNDEQGRRGCALLRSA